MARRAVGYLGVGLLALTGLAAAGAGAVWVLLPGLVESRAEDALRTAGFPEADLSVDRLGLESAEVAVRLAGGQGAERVRLDYTPGGLWAGRVERVVLTGLTLDVMADAGGLRPTAMQETGGPSTGAGMPEIPVGEMVIENARINLLTPAGPVKMPLEGTLRQPTPGEFQFQATAGLPLGPVSGTAAVEGRYGPAGLTLAFEVVPDPVGTTATGRMAGTGRLTWSGEGLPSGRAELEIAGAALPDGTPLDAGLRWRGEGEAHDLQVLLRPGSDLSIQVAGVATRQPTGDFQLSGMVDLLTSDLSAAMRLAGLDLPLTGAGSANLRVAEAPLSGGMPPADLVLRLEQSAWPGILTDATVALAGRLIPGEKGWAFESQTDLVVEGRPDGALANALPSELAAKPLYFSLRPGPEQNLRIAAESVDGGQRITVAGMFGLEAGLTAAGGRLSGLEVVTGAEGLVRVGLTLDGTSLDASPWNVALRGLGGTMAYVPGAEQAVKIDASAASVRMSGDPAPVAPFALNLALSGDPSGTMTFQADASAASGAIVVEAFGTAQPAAGTGRADVQLYPVRFGAGGRKPEELSPLLSRQIEEAEGTLALKGNIAWGGKDGPTGRAEMLLDGVGLTGPTFIVQGLSGVVTASSLFPLRMPEQELAVGLLDVGLPLTNGVLRFALPSEQRLEVAQATFDWAGGTVRAVPFAANLDALTGTVVLEAEGLELGQVLARAGVEGLAASGTLNGRIPVVVRDDGIRFEEGRLDAAGAGTLRYDPADPPSFLDPTRNDSTSLVMQALQNFRYTELGITIDGEAGGEMEATLRVKGANPDFYDGYPVALNLNLSGALASILQSGVTSYRMPDTVKARIEQFRNTGQ